MTLRRAHGTGASALLRAETLPPDEQPAGVPDPTGPVERRADGTLTPHGARVLGRKAGRRSAQRRKYAAKLADQLGMVEVGEDLAPYVDAAAEFAEAQLAHVAANVGGGEVGPGPASIIQSAALALAASRRLYAEGSKTGNPKLLGQAAQLADRSRQGLLTAHELAVREARERIEREHHDGDIWDG